MLSTERRWKTAQRRRQQPIRSPSSNNSSCSISRDGVGEIESLGGGGCNNGHDGVISSGLVEASSLDFLDSVLTAGASNSGEKQQQQQQQPLGDNDNSSDKNNNQNTSGNDQNNTNKKNDENTNTYNNNNDIVDPILELVTGANGHKQVGAYDNDDNKKSSSEGSIIDAEMKKASTTPTQSSPRRNSANSAAASHLYLTGTTDNQGNNKKKDDDAIATTNNNNFAISPSLQQKPLFSSSSSFPEVTSLTKNSRELTPSVDTPKSGSNKNNNNNKITTPNNNESQPSSLTPKSWKRHQQQLQQRRRDFGGGGADNNQQQQNGGEDNLPPIPFFGTNQSNNSTHDDDESTISQITTSIASQSFFNESLYGGGSSRGGSFVGIGSAALGSGSGGSGNRNNKKFQNQSCNNTYGEASFADTLDEIADMLHPNEKQQQQQQNAQGVHQNGGIGGVRGMMRNNNNTNNMNHPRSNMQSFDDLYQPKGSDRYPQFKPATGSSSIGSRGRRERGGGSTTTTLGGITAKLSSHLPPALVQLLGNMEPVLSKLRLQLLYLQTKVVPRSWKLSPNNNHKKEDDDDDDDGTRGTRTTINGVDDTDYFGMLMSSKKDDGGGGGGGVIDSGGGSVLTAGTAKRKIPRSKRRERIVITVVRLVIIFAFMTMFLLVLRLVMMHAMPIPKNPFKRKSYSSGSSSNNIRGGMTVRGGMAHHDTKLEDANNINNDVEDLQQLRAVGEENDEASLNDRRSGNNNNNVKSDNNDFSHGEHIGMDIPEVFTNLADVNEPFKTSVDIPFFWHIPRTGGGTVNDILGGCLSLALASDAGGNSVKEDTLEVVKFQKHFSYVNVDTSTSDGIKHARDLNLASSGLADVVVGTLLQEVPTIFTPKNKGRMFTLFRHPVERSVSLFYYVQDIQWRRRQTFDKEKASLTIEEYFKGGLAENNWMTRFLTNQLTKGELTQDDVNLAKEVLRRKCLVGLLSEKGESFARFEKYFGWQLKNDEEKECHEKKLQWAWPLKHRHDDVDEGSPLWDLIVAHNIYDMELYDYAENLFKEQERIFRNIL